MSWSKKQLSTLITVSITSFMGTFLISSINIALPAIEKSFALNAVSLSWIITSFLVATGMFLLPVGKLGDISGNVRLFKLGLIVFTLASMLCAISPSGIWLITARFVQGVGSAFTSTTGQAILVANFPARNRGQVIGISVASVYTGLATGPFIGGFLTQALGWHSLFYVAAVLGILSTAIAFSFLEKDVATNLLWSMIPETKAFCPRGLGIIPYKLPSSVELAEATIKELQDYDVVMWEKHGVFAVDCDAMQAFDQIDVLNKSALIYIAAKNMGFEPDGMSQEQMKEMTVAFNLPK